jgi:UDP-N-acetylglucosamine diphosphorylase/glucosamine-1-phosphate N-acetyltransferase
VRVEPSATLMPGVVLDATRGPVVIGAGAIVRPNAVISGPAYVGPGSTVLDNAQLWGGVALGPVCKVGGEVNGTIFQGHANKAHEGFLGDSWLGEWVNLGAGTVTSNLLNTYGEITTVSADGLRRRTGLRFLGAIIGDHAKTAIGTRLMTGTMVGTGAMIALSKPPPTAVPSFAWLTESRTLVYRLSRFLEVAETVMARRSRSLGDAERARLRALHEAESSRFIVPPIDFQI